MSYRTILSVAVIRIQVTMVPNITTLILISEVTKEDSAAYKIDLMAASSTFRNFLYEGYYAEYQITTNLSHDIYAGYVATTSPNMPNQARITNTLMAGRENVGVSFTRKEVPNTERY